MKKSRFSDSQIIAVLKQGEDGTPVPELCREHAVSSATFYKWRAKYGGMDPIVDGAYEGTGGREPPPEEEIRRIANERGDPSGSDGKNVWSAPSLQGP